MVGLTTQNELNGICGSILQSTKVSRIQAAKILSAMAGDASNKEQLAICIRFVDQSTLKIEWFICFSECITDTTGEAIADLANWILGSFVTLRHAQTNSDCDYDHYYR